MAPGSRTDLYNRQLHPEERTLAKDIAEKSGGQYTQEQVEDQMRIMGMCVNGGCVSPGVAEELNGRTPTDPGAQWINTGLTSAEGNPLVIQALPEANQALQAYIMANYNSATPGQVPSAFTYVPTPTGTDVRGTVANVAGGVSTAAGRFGAITVAGASIPSPYAPGLTAACYFATVAGIVADAVGQLAKPNPGLYVTSGIVDLTSEAVSKKFPITAPVINEIAEKAKNSAAALGAAEKFNYAIGVEK